MKLFDLFKRNGYSRACSLKETVNECLCSIQKYGFSPKGKIAMTRYYGFVLDDNGKQIFIGDKTREKLKGLKSYSKIISVAGTFGDEVGLMANGSIVANFEKDDDISARKGLTLLHQGRDVESISAGEGHIVGVKYDGTVVCWDGPGDWTYSPKHFKIVREWRNIKQVAVGFENIIALSNDGHVLGYGYCMDYSKYYGDYSDFVQVDAYGHYYGDTYSMALRKNGTVMSDSFEEVSAWHDTQLAGMRLSVYVGMVV